MSNYINGKKIMAGVLALSMVCGCAFIPNSEVFEINNNIVASAELETLTYDGFEYIIYDDDTIRIIQYTGNDTSVTIPSEIDGKKVNSIGDSAFENNKNLVSVKFPNTVDIIDKYTFLDCTNLTSIEIPNSVTGIGIGAFGNCTSLTNIEIPNSVTYIGMDAFYDTPWLKNKQKENPFVIVNGILIDGTTCKGDIVIPNSVTYIQDNAFCECTNLTSIEIPNSVTFIGRWAFSDCINLINIKILNPDICIAGMAFSDCKNLKDVYYAGTEEQWNKENIFDGNGYLDYLDSVNIHFNSNTNDNSNVSKTSIGDLSGDGKISTDDALITLKQVVGLVELTPEQQKLADIDKNGIVDSSDALEILKFVVGIITEF